MLILLAAGALGAVFTQVWQQGGNSTKYVGDPATRVFRISREFPYDGRDVLDEVKKSLLAEPSFCADYEMIDLQMSHVGEKVTFAAVVGCD